ncbi:unnamed protein product [Brassica oleracea var. botrytis]
MESSLVLWLMLIATLAIIHSVQAQDQQGFISLDCGLPENEQSPYNDTTTGLNFSSDATFIQSGKTGKIQASSVGRLMKPYTTVRYFPDGTRNCYSLNVQSWRRYLIRATFTYGNYDGLNVQPVFDLYLGPNRWATIDLETMVNGSRVEILHKPTSNSLNICLVKTGETIPLISTLELRPMENDCYITKSGSLNLHHRSYLRKSESNILRYANDTYDRIWNPYFWKEWTQISTTLDAGRPNSYDPPKDALKNAATPTNASGPLTIRWSSANPDAQYHLYAHFSEIQDLQANETREFNMFWNGDFFYGPLTPLKFGTNTIFSKSSRTCDEGKCSVQLIRTNRSTLPPLLNAFEVYTVIQFPLSETDKSDVNAIRSIATNYELSRINWQGDPCFPQQLRWDGLNCTNADRSVPPRITSLNLSSSGLTGTIASAIQNLTELEKLDLSNNNLTGGVPEFLGNMKSLLVINLSGNDLNGLLPQALQRKGLELFVEGNPGLHASGPSRKLLKNKVSVPIVASVVASAAIAIAVLVLFLVLRKKRSKTVKDLPRPQSTPTVNDTFANKNSRRFTYSEVIKMTNNFQRVLGKGGFGMVYHGSINGSQQVAAKLLSQSSAQGYKEFKAEVDLLLRVHHTNLVTLVGYCYEGDHLALIYEFLPNGDLKQHLSGKGGRPIINWRIRLQIALEAALGLEYLHIGCTPPMVHRDVKTANILLDENFKTKLADFGLSRSFQSGCESQDSTVIAGTCGYLDPEYCRTSRLAEKSDVYSYGVVLLEMITNQPVISEKCHIAEWVGSTLKRAVELAMSCADPFSSKRPTMSQVISELKECIVCENSRMNNNGGIESQQASIVLDTSPGNDFLDIPLAGFTSLDCGLPANETSPYEESYTKLMFTSDETFIRSGRNGRIRENLEGFAKPYETLRYFPDGIRNCYGLKVEKGRTHMIVARFVYGNYDGFDVKPKFDLYIGPNLWATIDFQRLGTNSTNEEILHMPTSDSLQICLVKTGETTPFISALEIRALGNDSYITKSGSLMRLSRSYFSKSSGPNIRYMKDIYDREWVSYGASFQREWTQISPALEVNNSNKYVPPKDALIHAATPTDANAPLTIELPSGGSGEEYYLYAHFAEIQDLQANDTREFNISLNREVISDPIIPKKLDITTVSSVGTCQGMECILQLTRTNRSTLPPLINALEIFTGIRFPQSETDENDVAAIKNIEAKYGLNRIDWKGDPCVPRQFLWDGLNCSNTDMSIPPRITSFGLTGNIAAAVQNLPQLEKLQVFLLDLSNNNLTGGVPEFLGNIKSLMFINLSRNNLNGSIPQALQRQGLQLFVDGNPMLCLSNAWKRSKKNVLVPIVASIASAAVVIAILFFFLVLRKKKSTTVGGTSTVNDTFANKRSRRFTYSEVIKMTNNFQRVIGTGGSGMVYQGTVNCSDVAVKLLSQTSTQGYEQFKADRFLYSAKNPTLRTSNNHALVDLLLRVHHTNLVSLVGYCYEGDHLALIYEFLPNGDLKQHLSGKGGRYIINWSTRLRIALETALGLEYLHVGCTPPMVHRDVKTANILLDENFKAKLTDFGISRSFGGHESQEFTEVAGIHGYIDPEYYRTNRLAEKSDVYGYGVVLLEMITNKPVISEEYHVAEWAGTKINHCDITEIMDPKLCGGYDHNSAWRALDLAVSCTDTSSSKRPIMSQVINELKESITCENSRMSNNQGLESQEMNISLDTSVVPRARYKQTIPKTEDSIYTIMNPRSSSYIGLQF